MKPCKHPEWFAVAIDVKEEFLVVECCDCGERRYRFVDFLTPDE